jgi:hypothetical protein
MFWDITSCSVIDGISISKVHPEDGCRMRPQFIGNHLQEYTCSYPISLHSEIIHDLISKSLLVLMFIFRYLKVIVMFCLWLIKHHAIKCMWE